MEPNGGTVEPDDTRKQARPGTKTGPRNPKHGAGGDGAGRGTEHGAGWRWEVGCEMKRGAGAGDRRAWLGRLARAWKRAGGRLGQARRGMLSIGRLD